MYEPGDPNEHDGRPYRKWDGQTRANDMLGPCMRCGRSGSTEHRYWDGTCDSPDATPAEQAAAGNFYVSADDELKRLGAMLAEVIHHAVGCPDCSECSELWAALGVEL